jgi:hypothetical protein
MKNIDDALRALLIEEASIDIRLDTRGDENAIFDLYSDHCGGDDDAYYMIHEYAQGDLDTTDLLPRTIAFLHILTHIPMNCDHCELTD